MLAPPYSFEWPPGTSKCLPRSCNRLWAAPDNSMTPMLFKIYSSVNTRKKSQRLTHNCATYVVGTVRIRVNIGLFCTWLFSVQLDPEQLRRATELLVKTMAHIQYGMYIVTTIFWSTRILWLQSVRLSPDLFIVNDVALCNWMFNHGVQGVCFNRHRNTTDRTYLLGTNL